MWINLYNFVSDIEKIEGLLYELAAHEDHLQTFGLRSALRMFEDFGDLRTAFDEFSTKLAICVRTAPLIDKSLANQLNSLLSETGIEKLINQLAVRIRLAERERIKPISQIVSASTYLFRRLIRSKEVSLFSDETMHLDGVLASLARLRSQIKFLSDEYYRRTSNDDEIFKPSNVNINIIVNHIELAIDKINESSEIGPSEKERLVTYLQEAKAELASDTPAWKKVIGALIICATLLSGVAAAPQAIENLNTAIKHILGTSIEKTLPNLLPAPKESEEQNNSFTETIIT